MTLRGKNILLGVSAGIAAFKIPQLIRLLKKDGAYVQVILTPGAKDFVTPLTLSTVSKNPVFSEFYRENGQWNNHVSFALWADCFVLAPATMNTLAKMTNGICDNLLMATYFSLKNKPCFFAPAMDLDMYKHFANQNNISKLKESGALELPAQKGELASSLEGIGRMMEPEEILENLRLYFEKQLPLQGKRCLVSAGPTRESIDPVRYIGNRSSGKMGVAIAQALRQKGAEVILVHGPIHKNLSLDGLKTISVTSAIEMDQAIQSIYDSCDLVVMAAAVADYRVDNIASQKIKKTKQNLTLNLVKNPDILAALGKKKKHQILVGFALETDNEVTNAHKKMKEKNLDFIVLNNPNHAGAAFDHDTNEVSLLFPDGEKMKISKTLKSEIAKTIVQQLEKLI